MNLNLNSNLTKKYESIRWCPNLFFLLQKQIFFFVQNLFLKIKNAMSDILFDGEFQTQDSDGIRNVHLS